LDVLLDQGVDCFKTDFGERIPTDVLYHDGSDSQRMHELRHIPVHQKVFDVVRRRGEVMAESLRGGLWPRACR
jgi:alpha-D-xyloside xylohydrolase